jgi:hypothetical protein
MQPLPRHRSPIVAVYHCSTLDLRPKHGQFGARSIIAWGIDKKHEPIRKTGTHIVAMAQKSAKLIKGKASNLGNNEDKIVAN